MNHTLPGTSGRVRILFVEDNLDQAHLVKFLLEAGGDYSVTLAQDGDRGIELIHSHGWDLLITDLNLPGADGTEIVEAARTRNPDLPILATTGYTGPEYSQRAMERGADAVLVKPLDRDELLERVRTLVSEGRPRRTRTPPSTPLMEPASPRPRRPIPPKAALQPDRQISHSPFQVLAISTRPGEVEAGIGGALLRHREAGHEVVILYLSPRLHANAPSEGRGQARECGRRLGVRTFVGDTVEAGGEMKALTRLAAGAVDEISPDLLYLPTLHHRDPMNRAAHRAALGAATGVKHCFAYDAGAIEPTFSPDLVVPLSNDLLDRKIEALLPYQKTPLLHLGSDFVRSAALYWGRFAEGVPAEALERLTGPHPISDTVNLHSEDAP